MKRPSLTPGNSFEPGRPIRIKEDATRHYSYIALLITVKRLVNCSYRLPFSRCNVATGKRTKEEVVAVATERACNQ